MWLTRLRVEEAGHDLSGRDVDELIAPLVWRSDVYGDILIPPRFRTNYCSVPRWPVLYWMFGGKARKPSVGHDFPYTVHGVLKINYDVSTGEHTVPVFQAISREEADDLFLEMLSKEPLISEGEAHTMHKAVRWFGESSWRDDTNILQLPEIQALIQEP